MLTHDTRPAYGKPRYAAPSAYAAAIATGDARWSNHWAGPDDLEAHAFGLELAEMHSLAAAACRDLDVAPRFPLIAYVPGRQMYGAVTANHYPYGQASLRPSPAQVLADLWNNHYRSALTMEQTAAECEREELAEVA